MYPTSSNSVSKSLLNEYSVSKQDIMEFGEDAQTEQMLQILNSNKIRDRIIQRFNLFQHYDIDTTCRNHNVKLYNRFKSNITFTRTEYMAVKITVLDKNPQTAADMANMIAALLDTVKNEMQKERALQGFKIVENEYLILQKQTLAMEDSLTVLRKLGINDYETQSEMMNQQLAVELAKNNKAGIRALEDKFKILALYGGAYVSLSGALEYEQKQLSYIKARYEEAKVDATENIPQKFIVESAYKSEQKAYPIIWVVVVISTLGALLMGILVIFMVERSPDFFRKLRQMQAENT